MISLNCCSTCGAKVERLTDYSKVGEDTEMVRCSNLDCDDWTVVGAQDRETADKKWNELHSSSSGVAGGYTAPMPIQDTPFMIAGQWLSEQQAQRNHSQSLERLAERGGVSPREALALMTESDWNEYRDISEVEALNRILSLRRQWIGESAV